MFSTKMRAIYMRLMIIGLLSMGLFIFGYSDEVETVQASANCVEDCESSRNACQNDCFNSCEQDSTPEECSSCVLSCRSTFMSCMNHAVYCDTEVYNRRCGVGFGQITITGGSYMGYFLTCTNLNGEACVRCAGSTQYCEYEGGGTPTCFGNPLQ